MLTSSSFEGLLEHLLPALVPLLKLFSQVLNVHRRVRDQQGHVRAMLMLDG